MLAAEVLAAEARLIVAVVPLLETIDDLRGAPALAAEVFDRSPRERLEVMAGIWTGQGRRHVVTCGRSSAPRRRSRGWRESAVMS